MSEEIGRGKALDDAELEGVSGGISQKSAESAAWYACNDCNMSVHPPCKGSKEQLIAYMLEHNVTIRDPGDCPFCPW